MAFSNLYETSTKWVVGMVSSEKNNPSKIRQIFRHSDESQRQEFRWLSDDSNRRESLSVFCRTLTNQTGHQKYVYSDENILSQISDETYSSEISVHTLDRNIPMLDHVGNFRRTFGRNISMKFQAIWFPRNL